MFYSLLMVADISFLRFGPAVIAAASLFSSARGIPGTVPVWRDIPKALQASMLGLAVHFEEDSQQVSCSMLIS